MDRNLLLVLSMSMLMFSPVINADGILDESLSKNWHPVIGIGGGDTSTTNLGTSKYFPAQNPLTDEYYAYSPQNKAQSQGMFEVFVGAEHKIFTQELLQLGLAYEQTGTFNPKGSFVQGTDPQSISQYNYNFQVVTRQLLGQAKFMYQYHTKYYPYLLVGLGGSFNSSSDYNTNVPASLSYTRYYTNNISTTFAYRFGAGVDIDISTHMRLGVAYRFANLGGFNNDGASFINNVPMPSTLSQSSLYANEALVQLTYII